MKEKNITRLGYLAVLIIILFGLYVVGTYAPATVSFQEDNMTVEELANSPFMDHTHDVTNLVDPHRPVIINVSATVN